MKTADFLRVVTPSEGILFAAEPRSFTKEDGRKINYYKHTACRSHDDLAANCKAHSKAGNHSFFALASYEQEEYLTDDPYNSGKQKKKQRTQDNAMLARSMWLDIDCGKGKPYNSQIEGARALHAAVKKASLPPPTLVVSSGNGLHVYWAFTKDVPKDIWLTVAKRFKALMMKVGLEYDNKVTSNIACVLRPIGTYNCKNEPLEVKVLGKVRHLVRFSDWAKVVSNACKKHKVTVPKPIEPSLNSALGGGLDEYPPSDAHKIATQCAVMANMKATKGADQDEQQWYNALGILKYTEQGEEIAHEWSSGHDGYSPEATNAKLQQWTYGPTRCDTMRELFSECAECKLKCTSAIQLGHPDPEHQTTVEVVDEQADEVTVETLPELPEDMRQHYAWVEGKGLMAKVKDEDNNIQHMMICSQFPVPLFIFYDRVAEAYMVRITSRTAPFTWVSGDIPLDIVQRGGVNLVGALGGKCAVTVRDDGKKLARFMKTWVDIIRQSTDLQTMRDQMGWQKDGSFLLGNRLYKKNGDVRDVVVARGLAKYAESHTKQGDMQTFVDTIDKLYNRPRYQQYQFFWLASFGSTLLKFLHSHNMGVTLAAYSPDSGTGKTSVCKAAIANFGDPSGFGQQADGQDGATEYAITVMAGLRHNLPILIDEITGWDNQRLGKFLYRICNGTAKIQGSADGGLRDTSSYNWNTVSYITSNAPLSGKLSAEVKSSQAQLARLFDVRFHSMNFSTEDSVLFERLWQNSGNTGSEFIHYVVKHQDKVALLCRKILDSLNKQAHATQSARYWMMLAAVTLAAGHITKMLGMHQFDLDVLREWTLSRIAEIKLNAEMTEESEEDTIRAMLSELQDGMIVTIDAPTKRGDYVAFAPGYGAPRRNVSSRFIVSTGDIYIPVSVAKAWCASHNLDYFDLRRRLVDRKWLVDKDVRYDLGRGTSVVSTRVRCWQLNLQSAVNIIKSVDAGLLGEGTA